RALGVLRHGRRSASAVVASARRPQRYVRSPRPRRLAPAPLARVVDFGPLVARPALSGAPDGRPGTRGTGRRRSRLAGGGRDLDAPGRTRALAGRTPEFGPAGRQLLNAQG